VATAATARVLTKQKRCKTTNSWTPTGIPPTISSKLGCHCKTQEAKPEAERQHTKLGNYITLVVFLHPSHLNMTCIAFGDSHLGSTRMTIVVDLQRKKTSRVFQDLTVYLQGK